MSNNLPQEKIKKIQLFFRNCLLRKRINELHELNLHNYDTCSQDEFHKGKSILGCADRDAMVNALFQNKQLNYLLKTFLV